MENNISAKKGVLIVANTGEEGLGNLKGTRQLMKDYGDRIVKWFAIDGGLDSYINKAVGSKRYEITIETEGGHSYGAFGNRNAIAYLASLIDTLYTCHRSTICLRTPILTCSSLTTPSCSILRIGSRCWYGNGV